MAFPDLSAVFLIIFTALLLSLITLTQFFATYAAGYISAPSELATFTAYLESSVQENESYDIDISSLAANATLKDKMRLSLLLQEIQKCGDDMREALNRLLVSDLTASAPKDIGIGEVQLKPIPRFLWNMKKKELEDRVKRIDMLRLRFLVVYMSIVASSTRTNLLPPTPPITPEKHTATIWAGRSTPESNLSRSLSMSSNDSSETISSTDTAAHRPRLSNDSSETISRTDTVHRPRLSHDLTEGILAGRKEGRLRPLRRLNTQPIGHNNDNSGGGGQRRGWMGVVEELQRSPVMRERHASIERSRSNGGRPTIDEVFAKLP